MKTIKKQQKEEAPYILKLWGLQLPLDHPLTRKDVKQLFIAFLIFLLVLAAFQGRRFGWLQVVYLRPKRSIGSKA